MGAGTLDPIRCSERVKRGYGLINLIAIMIISGSGGGASPNSSEMDSVPGTHQMGKVTSEAPTADSSSQVLRIHPKFCATLPLQLERPWRAGAHRMTATEASDRFFSVEGIACTVQSRYNVKVGAGQIGTVWPKRLRFTVKLRAEAEDHEDAARRWLATERGQRHVADAAAASGNLAVGAVATEAPAAAPQASGTVVTGSFEPADDADVHEPGLFADVADIMTGIEDAGGEVGRRRSSRQTTVPKLLDPAADLPPGERFRLEGGRATGQRYEMGEEKDCTRPRCIADREKHVELQRKHAELQLKYDTETRRHAPLECLSPLPCLCTRHPPQFASYNHGRLREEAAANVAGFDEREREASEPLQ